VALALPLACDGDKGRDDARRDPFELPALTALGVRCVGEGEARRCRDRGLEASDFDCQGERCVQRHVRLPDDGEWRCAEREGVVWCAGGEPAAGVVTAASERGFRCGARRVPAGAHAGGKGERICVDPSPDYPNGERGRYACRFLLERGISRECVQEPTPVRPVATTTAPDCWLDRDCAPGRCDRGHCTAGGT
jgi:hypothetical protein